MGRHLGSNTETAHLLTSEGCSSTFNEPSKAKAEARLEETLRLLEARNLNPVVDRSRDNVIVATLSNGNTLTVRYNHD